LLTFFFRQMPELIERGHVLIAQPPLYKVKKGKQERYVKDDDELEAFVLQLALQDADIRIDGIDEPLAGADLDALTQTYARILQQLDRRDRTYPRRITERLIERAVIGDEQLKDEAFMTAWCALLEADLSAIEGGGVVVNVQFDAEHQAYIPLINIRIRGITESIRLGVSFFNGADYRAIVDLGAAIKARIPSSDAGLIVRRGERSREVGLFGGAVEWLLSEARRGLDVQRYKGLGEMNPDQLWQTTMDPAVRRMLRVTIEDSIAADQMFTTLMGDHVDPRREFIEANALSVVNLDV
ncbi:MAG: DNA gyrase subunit B, partial [Gammaproteobacteria bacterium]